jgi:diguanylate cyclase (GGDEF)-like protein
MIINITLISQVAQVKILEIVNLAQIDNLTGTWLRKSMISKIEAEHARFIRDNKPYSIILFDIDHFKKFNDTLGHAAGDEALKFVVNQVRSSIRKIDSFGRWGGEEFVILLPLTTINDAMHVAEKLKVKLESSYFEWHDKSTTVTCSFGVAESTTMHTVDGIITDADSAMYAAKKAGRSRVKAYSIDSAF